MDKWHTYSVQDTEEKLNTSVIKGLSRERAKEIADELTDSGIKNRSPLYLPKKKSTALCVAQMLLSLNHILFLTVAVFAFLSGHKYFGAWVIALICLQDAVLGFMNLRAVRAKEKANLYSNPTVKVMRSGTVTYTDSRNIVPGDIIMFSVGDVITCDARLIFDNELLVDEFIYDTGSQKLTRRRTKKNSQKVYADNIGNISSAENMVYAGSVVLSGSGSAIAARIGQDAELAKYLSDGEMAGDAPRSVGVSRLVQKLRIVSVAASVAVLTMSVIGMFTLSRMSMYAVFMMALSSVIYVSSSAIDIWSRIILYSSAESLRDGTVITKNKAFDALTDFSDVILLGHAGLTDGELHIASMFLSGRKFDSSIIEIKPDRAFKICEYIYTYLRVTQGMDFPKFNAFRNGLESFIKMSGYDTAGAELKLKSLYYLENEEEKMGFACAEAQGGFYRTAVVFDIHTLDICEFLRVGDMSCPIDEKLKEKISDYIDECESRGDKLIFVISEEITKGMIRGENTVLEGIIAFEEHIVEDLNATIECYRSIGANITAFFTDESPETVKYLIHSGFASSMSDPKIAFASEFEQNNFDILTNYGKYRAYLGFGNNEYMRLLTKMKEDGKTVLAYGVDDAFNGVLTCADVSVTCNCIDYASREYRESYYEKFPEQGTDTSRLASQRGRIASDILVDRAKDVHGGLHQILTAADASCTGYINLSYFLKYFALQASMVIALALLSMLTGIVMITSPQILTLYLFATVVGISVFSNNCPSEDMLRKNKRSYVAMPSVMITKNLPRMIARAISVAIYAVVVILLLIFGMLQRESIAFSSFMGAYIIFALEVLTVSAEYSKKNRKSRVRNLLLIISVAFVVAILAACVLLYFADTIFEGEYIRFLRIPNNILREFCGGEFNFISLILVPIFCLINLTVEFIYGKISHKISAKANFKK